MRPRITDEHGEPLEGALTAIALRKVFEGHHIYDALFTLTGEDSIPVQIHRENPSSLVDKVGRNFKLYGATLRFEHGEPPPLAVRHFVEWLRRNADERDRKILLDWITSMQIQLAQTRMVIQVSDVKEAG